MATLREIKKRMTAVGSIARITKTMQMIANAKFAAAVQRAKATKPYTQKIRQLVAEVAAAAGDVKHPLIDGPAESPKKELLLIVSSDRGLCGAYNTNILRKAAAHVRAAKGAGTQLDIEVAGKKALAAVKYHGYTVAERHTFGDKPKYEDIERVAQRYIDVFNAGAYDTVRVAYTRFESNSRQVADIVPLLPLKPQASAPAPGAEKTTAGTPSATYEFSPSAEGLLGDLLPQAVKASLFQAINDAVVSEQIMRMVAMKAATENAKDLGRTLKRRFNRARQSKITTELTEIVSGAAALE